MLKNTFLDFIDALSGVPQGSQLDLVMFSFCYRNEIFINFIVRGQRNLFLLYWCEVTLNGKKFRVMCLLILDL